MRCVYVFTPDNIIRNSMWGTRVFANEIHVRACQREEGNTCQNSVKKFHEGVVSYRVGSLPELIGSTVETCLLCICSRCIFESALFVREIGEVN